MELRSGRRLCSTVRTPGHGLLDRISALPDDLLLVILARLRCVATAARTAVLSRRWRNLWTLLSTVVFRDVKYSSLEPALARLASPTVSLIDIHVPEAWRHISPREHALRIGVYLVTSLLCAAARLEPEQLVFVIPNIV
jgi:hypothetical protein